MKRLSLLSLVLVSFSLVGCSFEKGSIPAGPTPTQNQDLPFLAPGATLSSVDAAALSGTWNGTSTVAIGSLGASGTLSITFTGNGNGNDVHADATWTSGLTSLTSTGKVGGTLAHLSIVPDNPHDCNYQAEGAVVGNVLSGTYSTPGESCHGKHGTFTLTKVPGQETPTPPTPECANSGCGNDNNSHGHGH